MRRLVPRGFVFIWVPKQHVQAVCRQVPGWGRGRAGWSKLWAGAAVTAAVGVTMAACCAPTCAS